MFEPNFPVANKSRRAIFGPLTVKRTVFPNRIVMPPIGTNFATLSGELSDEHMQYYRERARGSVGLIIMENVCVDFPVASNGFTQIRFDLDKFLPRMSAFVDEMHSYGAKVGIQINHAGASANPAITGMPSYSSSSVVSKQGVPAPTPMKTEHIWHAIEAYAATAERAKRAGFDLVEVHGGHSYLINQFLSPLMNKRTDRWGGSRENRARFAREVLRAVRDAVGADFPISIRLSADEFIDGGNTLDDTLEMASYFDEFVDIYNVSAAVNQNLQY